MKKLINFIKSLFRKKTTTDVMIAHKNKYKKGDKIYINGDSRMFYVCDFMNESQTSKYIIIDEKKKYLYEWIDESELSTKPFNKFKTYIDKINLDIK